MAVPRVSGPGSSGVALPQPLPPSEAARIRRIFAEQARGDIPAAIADTASLTDTTLLGHILADRYLGRCVRAGAEELQAWLARYADLPDAPAIRALLLTRRPSDAPLPPEPQGEPVLTGAVVDGPDVVDRSIQRNPVLDRSVREPARAGQADRALRLIARTRGLTPIYGALLRAEVAQALFIQGRDAEALRIAEAAHRQAGGQIGLAPYIAGLAAWRLDRPETARPLFEAAYRAELAPAALRAAGAFWAARARLRSRDLAGYAPWLRRTAESPRTFHGLLAAHALGYGPAPSRETLGSADIEAILATPQGLRAFALVQVGQPKRAEAELRRLWPSLKGQQGLQRSVLLVAQAAGLDDLAAELSPLVRAANGQRRAGTDLPAPRLRPTGGFRVDPAMVYAMARIESNFDTEAVSPAGARGLMQMMPETASYVVDGPAGPDRMARRLHDPATNLDLAQRYILRLAEHDAVDGDLMRLLASYNAGPGSLRRWEGAMRYDGDPLLFIETIPNDEARAYVPRVLAYTWLYAAQMRLPAPSLEALASGAWPRFTPQPRRPPLSRLH